MSTKKKKKRLAWRKSAATRTASAFLLRFTTSEKAAFVSAADLCGLSLAAWVRERLRKVAAKELSDAGLPVPFLAPVGGS